MNVMLYVKDAAHVHPNCMLLEVNKVDDERMIIHHPAQNRMIAKLELPMAGRDPAEQTAAEKNMHAPPPPVEYVLQVSKGVLVLSEDGKILQEGQDAPL